MDPASPAAVYSLLRSHGLRPRKRLGQNFLCDRNILNRIAGSAVLAGGEPVVEIGAGLGSLTQSLADLCASVTAVEIDAAFEPILHETLKGRTNVRLVFADFLALDTRAFLDDAFAGESGAIAGNIPYNITTPILARLFEVKDQISRIVLLVQSEVADRLTAEPGTKSYGALSVFAQFHCRVRLIGRVAPHLFRPEPDVSSTIIHMEPVHPGTVPVRDPRRFFQVVRGAFGQRRKTLVNALTASGVIPDKESAAALLAQCDIGPQQRGETLTLDEFARVADALAAA